MNLRVSFIKKLSNDFVKSDFKEFGGRVVDDTETLCELDAAFRRSGASSRLNVRLNKNGTVSRQSKTALTRAQLDAYVNYAWRMIEQAGREMADGNACQSPYEDACEYCEFSAVCDFGDLSGRQVRCSERRSNCGNSRKRGGKRAMNRNFTRSQLLALDISQEKNVAVSASAGTGKTTVLVERIFRLLEAKRTSVDRLLVVTFTKLAAAEMKERLKESLSERLSEPFFAEQAQKLEMADISTLHAFCADALRSYFYVLGLEPNFSVAEDSVAQELKNDAFDRVAESELNAEDEVYLRLVEMLGKKSEQTSFKQTVFRLYDFFVCRPDFDGWFEEKRKYYFAEGEGNPFLSALDDELKKGAFAFESAAETACARGV